MNVSHQQHIAVRFDYPVHFAHGIFDSNNALLADVITRIEPDRKHRVLVFIDEGLANAHPDLSRNVIAYFSSFPHRMVLVDEPLLLPGGEKAKTKQCHLDTALNAIGNDAYRLCRQSVVLAIGGGSFLDIAGLAASLVHRGLRIVRVPTTVLAQNDAAVGVKNGMDLNGQKNFIGTFAPPFAVVCDFDLLETLTDKYWLGGIAEAFKVAIILDAHFFDFLCQHAHLLRQRDANAMRQLIQRCAMLHLDHIRTNGDPFETGTARPLDFGHWSAHKLEVMSDYTLGHGQAVAIGIAIDSCYAAAQKLISIHERDTILSGLRNSGLPIYTPLLREYDEFGQLRVLCGLADFREHLGGELALTLPNGIGEKTEIHTINDRWITDAINHLQTVAEETEP